MNRTSIHEGKTEVAAAVAAGLALASQAPTIQNHEGFLYAFVPNGSGGFDLKAYPELARKPRRIDTTVNPTTAAALIAYIAIFGQKSASIVFADRNALSFTAALDYHTPEQAEHIKHRAVLRLQQTDPWREWLAIDRQPQTQETLGRFIESHLPDIAEPDGGLLLEACLSFEATIGVQAKSVKRLNDGTMSVVWAEDLKDVSPIKLPTTFKLALQPFHGAKTYAVEARLRYSLKNGALSIWFELVRPQAVIDAAFADVVTEVEKGTADSVKAVLLGTL